MCLLYNVIRGNMSDIIQTSDLSSTFQALRHRDLSKIERAIQRVERQDRQESRSRSPYASQLAPITTVSTGSWGNGEANMSKYASGGGGIIYGQPQFFSPVHTPINWQIPSKKIEQYQWARFFYCLTPENKILMSDGTEKKICDIKPEDKIIDENGNVQRVLKVHTRDINEEIIDLTLGGDNNTKISITNSHEIKVVKKEEWENLVEKWEEAKDVKEDDALISPELKSDNGFIPDALLKNKTYRKITKIERRHYQGIVYDLEIENNHTYCVNGCVVHNSNEPKVASAIDFYCFDEMTQILLADGSQTIISAIDEGDQVRSHDGSINTVIKVNKRETEDEEMLGVKIAGVNGSVLTYLKVTPGHSVLTDKDGEIKFVQIGSLKEGDYLLTPCNYDRSEIYNISNDFAWLIGIYAAEGCGIPYEHMDKKGKIEKYYKGVYFSISSEEEDLAQTIKSKIISVYGKRNISIRKFNSNITIAVYGQDIADDLNGASPGLSSFGTKRFAAWVMKTSNENLINLMAGFYSGDGCYNQNNGFQGVGVSKKMADQIANICDIVGLEYSYSQNMVSVNYEKSYSKSNTKRVAYNIRISRRACSVFENLSYKVRNPKNIDETFAKNIPYFVKGKYIYRKICEIKKYRYDGFLYDLTIENKSSYVANRIAVHNSSFPMSSWTHECKNREIKIYFDKFKKRLKLENWCRLISHEIHLMGDCYPLAEIDCSECNGTGRIGSDICEHEGGTIRRLVLLNPDFIEVSNPTLSPEPVIYLRPDEEMINMITRRTPGYEKFTPEVRKLILSGQPIRMDNRSVSHLKYGACGYEKYGIGMVRRLFPILSYKTKLMVAQWIVAERLIVPIKVVKVGNDERPAGPADIAAVQAQLAQTANDPNLTLVTHHAFEYDFVGSAGKVLTLSNEFELINQEILDGMMINNALLNGEGPNFTHSADTQLLTNNGLKNILTFDIEKDLVATFNIHTKKLEYQKATQKFEYNWNSIDGDDPPLKRFLTNRIDMLVTPTHKMLLKERKLTTGPRGQKIDGQKEGYGEWEVVRAGHVKNRSRFRACVDGWDGITEDKDSYCGIPADDFLRIVGWYASEGYRDHVFHKDGTEHVNKVSFSQSPTANAATYEKMKTLLAKNNLLKTNPANPQVFILTKQANEGLVKYLSENMGRKANTKCIPQELKNLSQSRLSVLLEALVDGDGNIRDTTKKKPTDKKYYSYTTVSTQLRDDVIEILFKLGFSPRFSTIRFDAPQLQTKYTISWAETETGKFPVLESRKWDNSKGKCNTKSEQVISDEDYVGKVWCVEVPNHFIITERNGLFGIHGNSSAAVGIEAMIQRLTTFRASITEWLEEKIYEPEARRQGFVEKNEDTGEDEVIVPKIKWDSMHLRDQQQYRTFLIQLYEKGLLSAQTVLESFDLDPDQEIERKRYDALQLTALGQQGGAGGAGGGGGGMGGLPMPGGGGGGGMGGEPPIGAPGAPGGDMGGGTAPGEGPAAPAGGGPVISKSSSITAETADPSQFGGRVLKKKTRERMMADQYHQQRIHEQQQKRVQDAANPDKNGQTRDEKGRIIFTKAERDLMPHLLQAKRDGLFGQYGLVTQFRVSNGDSEYAIDFAFPQLKLGVEADGEIFHSAPKQIQHDKERDMNLAHQGWTILRFNDTEIEKRPQQIVQQIIKTLMQKQLNMKNLSEEKQA